MRVKVRATINLSGLSAGAVAIVDPEIPYIAMCMDAGYLVRTGAPVHYPDPVPTGATRPAVEPEPVQAVDPVEAVDSVDPVEPEPVAATPRKRAPRKKKTADSGS